ncbi:MAG TPA: DUF5919 domain-containing protein [Acidimicrobiales bacterium]|nr:DUF5919 domain-containing protein [Acidimicrobiales bacterium]
MTTGERGHRLGSPPRTVLAVLLTRHNLHRFGMFRARYEEIARELDRSLVATSPSRAQWHRWMTGDLKRLPYVNHCRVLEAMLPGWRADQLFAPADSMTDAEMVCVDKSVLAHPAARAPGANQARIDSSGPYADVTAVFASRTDFAAACSPINLFDGAREVRAAGLSLNLLCQQYADHQLRRLIESGASLTCLFLDPDGSAMKDREREEGIAIGHLAILTAINIDLLVTLRRGLSSDHADSIRIGVYDETVRFNLILVDEDLCVAQPYLPAMRGIDSPTFMIRRSEQSGLYRTFEQMFCWTMEQSTPL